MGQQSLFAAIVAYGRFKSGFECFGHGVFCVRINFRTAKYNRVEAIQFYKFSNNEVDTTVRLLGFTAVLLLGFTAKCVYYQQISYLATIILKIILL